MGVKKSDEEVLSAFRKIVESNPQISQNDYDRLKIENKPGRMTLQRHFGISWDALVVKALTGEVRGEEQPEISASRQYLIIQNKQLKKQLERQQNLTQVFIENCLAEIEKLNIKPVKIPPKDFSPDNLEFHALRSDAQVGQVTDKAYVQGISEYNNEIYEERVKRWTEKVILFREQDKCSLGLNKLVIHHLGDQVEGECIYGGQPFYLDLSLTDQLFRSVEVESNAILALASVFPEIEVYTVTGNHGRPGKKGDNHARTNFDYLFYRTLQTTLSRQKNIRFFVSESPSMVVQHGEYNFLLNHCDNTKAWNGIPFYGLERMYNRLNSLFGIKIDVVLGGHHHQPANISDRVIINGSLPGGSDLSINRMGITNEPSQKIFYFSGRYGINRETNLHLADKMEMTADEQGVYTAYV